MRLFHIIRSSMRRMPGFLRMITAICLGFSLFLPVSLLPMGEHEINGVKVTFVEFWQRGGGPALAGVGMLSGVLAYGFIRARRWVRFIPVGLGWSLVVAVIVVERELAEMVTALFLFGIIPTWYFYFRRSVRRYFGVTA